MKIYSSYSIKIKHYNNIFRESVSIYRSAVNFFIDVCLDKWDVLNAIEGDLLRQQFIEHLCHTTSGNPNPEYGDFDTEFYKFPSYMRRGAINEAVGKVCSYKANLANWEISDPRIRGKKPSPPKTGAVYPAMYRDNCYVREDTYTASLKVFIHNTWDWVTVQLKKSDVDYILRRCFSRKECVPTLRKRGKEWFLDFPFEEKVKLDETPIEEQIIIATDLGINNSCTCVAMRPDGTVLGRHFLSLPREYDSLNRKISHIKYAQRHGSRNVSTLWRIAKGVNDHIAVKTAQFIVDTAIFYNADVIVFEHLDINGKKKGSKKQRLQLWKARYVQSMVTDKAHRIGIRISHISAWGTSRLAYDGSGTVKRGKASDKTGGNYSLCEFTSGKVYNCDLNAAYNIGSRYFVREIMKSLPITDGQRISAKVPGCAKRSTCTLSTLISLNAELYAAA